MVSLPSIIIYSRKLTTYIQIILYTRKQGVNGFRSTFILMGLELLQEYRNAVPFSINTKARVNASNSVIRRLALAETDHAYDPDKVCLVCIVNILSMPRRFKTKAVTSNWTEFVSSRLNICFDKLTT